jgi:hypothetical protein
MASNIIIQFNEILTSFLVQIIPIVGSTYHNNIQTIIRFNSALPIENFLYYAIECRDKIMNRDESYFRDKTIVTSNVVRNDKLDEVFRLQNIYGILDKSSKDNVWDIFQALLILGEDYIKDKYSDKYQKNWIAHDQKIWLK